MAGFSPDTRDRGILHAIGSRAESTDRDLVIRTLRSAPADGGLLPAMAMARRCVDANVGTVVEEGLRCVLRPEGTTGLTVENASLFFQLLAQRMSPRGGHRPEHDVAAMTQLDAAQLPAVLEAHAAVLTLFAARHRLRSGGFDAEVAAGGVRSAPTARDLLSGRVAIDALSADVAADLLGAAALSSSTPDQVHRLLEICDGLRTAPGDTAAELALRAAGLLAQRQAGGFRGLAPIDTAVLDAADRRRLEALASGRREVVSYWTGGPALAPAKQRMSPDELDAFMEYLEAATGNVSGAVVSPALAQQIVQRWLSWPGFDLGRTRHAASSRDRTHGIRVSAGKAVSGGIPTVNLERYVDRGGRMERVGNVHLAVTKPQLEGPARTLAA